MVRRRMALGVAFLALLMLQPVNGVLAEDGPTDADLKAGYCFNVFKYRSADMCVRQTVPAVKNLLADECQKSQTDSQRLKDYLGARGYLFGPRDPTPMMIAGSRGDPSGTARRRALSRG
jgi:hypothetical protein